MFRNSLSFVLHCSLAMLGIAGMVAQELVSGNKLF